MPLHNNLQAQILVDGQPLEEYRLPAIEPASSSTMLRYVEATVGKQFKIQISWKAGYRTEGPELLCCWLYMDGLKKGKIYPCADLRKRSGALLQDIRDGFEYGRSLNSQGRRKAAISVFDVLDLGE